MADEQDKQLHNTETEETEKTASAAPNELEQLTKERDEYLDMARRIKAEFINYKKDEEKRSEKIRMLANLRMILEVISVLDGFNTATNIIRDKKGEAWIEGILQIKRQLEELLNKEGVTKIRVEPGIEFNPEYHESLLAVDSDLEEGMIVEEIRPGYELHGSVIRPAQVKLSKGIGRSSESGG